MEWREGHPQALWRACSDALHAVLFARWLPPQRAKRLLKSDLFDEAFGQGLYGLLAARSSEVVGIDLSVTITTAARDRYPDLHGVAADVRSLPFRDRAFDVVISNSTLDHFATRDDLLAGLRELSRILERRGALLLTLDNPANPIVALRNVTPRFWRRIGIVPYPVGPTLGRGSVRRALQQLGFDIVAEAAFMHCPRVLAVAMAGVLEKHAGARSQKRFVAAVEAFERMAEWPTRYVTGHYVAVKAVKR
jgi:SAM-dependent methyltransferase